MNRKSTILFNGEEYFDDRLFVIHLCKGTVKIQKDGVVATTIYHENPPADHLWCVVTYRNCNRYPIFRVDSFYHQSNAIEFLQQIEPTTPLISLNGSPMYFQLTFEEYCLWKKKNAFKEYDYKPLFSSDGTNPQEVIFQRIEQFQGIR